MARCKVCGDDVGDLPNGSQHGWRDATGMAYAYEHRVELQNA